MAEQIFKIVEKVGLRLPFSMRLMNVRSRPVSLASLSWDISLAFRSSRIILPKISSRSDVTSEIVAKNGGCVYRRL